MHIEASKSLHRWGAEAWDWRSALWLMLRHSMLVRYAGTWAGVVWMLAFPSVYLILLFYLSTSNGPVSTGGTHAAPLSLMLGIIPWNFAVQSLNGTVNNSIGSIGLMQRTFIPEIYLVLVPTISSFIEMSFLFILTFIIGSSYPDHTMSAQLLVNWLTSLPILIIGVLGLAQLILVVVLHWRDLRHMLQLLIPASVLVSAVMAPCSHRLFSSIDPTSSVVHTSRALFAIHMDCAHPSFWMNLLSQVALFVLGSLVLWKFGRRSLEA